MRAIVILLFAATAAAQPAPSASTVLANVQAFYANKHQMTATFHQTATIATYNATKSSDGQLWIEKPDSFRADYVARKGSVVTVTRSFISDGSTLWVVDHQNRQVVQSPVTSTFSVPVAWSFLTGNPSALFNVTFNPSGAFGAANATVLELTPKQPSAQLAKLFFVVDPTDFSVTESIVIDSSGNTNHFTFTNANFKATVRATTFQVNPASLPTYKFTVPTPAAAPPAAATSTKKTP